MNTPDIASLPERLLRRAVNPFNFRDLAGLVADLREAAAALASPAGEGGLPIAMPSDTGPFTDWLAREMPPGTIIGNPGWWATRILRQIARLATPEQPGSSVQVVGEVRMLRGCINSTSMMASLPDGGYDVIPQTSTPPAPAADHIADAGKKVAPAAEQGASINSTQIDSKLIGEQPEARGAWKVVPTEATQEMLEAWVGVNHRHDHETGKYIFNGDTGNWRACYDAMLASAPAAPAVGVDGVALKVKLDRVVSAMKSDDEAVAWWINDVADVSRALAALAGKAGAP